QRHNHLPHLAMFLARLQHLQTPLPRTPFQNIDIDMTHAPTAHLETTRFVEIDRVASNKRGPVIIDDVLFGAADDSEPCAERIARPIGRGAHDTTAGKICTDRVMAASP